LRSKCARKAKFTLESLETSHTDLIGTVKIHGFTFKDFEDAYRLDYFSRKDARATNIMFSMREGHTEDFLGHGSQKRKLPEFSILT